ncbi:hypothetical protein [Halorubrum sp. DTA98]|uniref:hypothetical protein n=1 Tax=Halorubrum sp. DTA98 TaxID=3402163 RepID=UPI003AB04482
MKQTTLRISEDLHEEIEAESEETGKSVSRIMRERLGEPRLREELRDELDDVESRLRDEFRGEIARIEQRISEQPHAEEAPSPDRTTDTEHDTDSDTATERPLSDALAGEQVDIAQILPSDGDVLERERDAVEACLHTLIVAGRATRDELAGLYADHPAGHDDPEVWLSEVITPVLYALAKERGALYTPEGEGGGRWVVPSSITLSDPTPPASGD